MATELKADERFAALGAQFDGGDPAEALVAVAKGLSHDDAQFLTHFITTLVASWPAQEPELLDAAARLAAGHHGLAAREPYLRSLLEYLASQSEIAQRLGGEPRKVLDDIELSLMLQARIQGEAIRTIWDEPMLHTRQAATLLGVSATNRERVRQLRLRSKLIGLPRGRNYLYPAFQFDLDHRCVHEIVASVNMRLDAAGDPWGVASWWFSVDDRLGARPAELVDADRDDHLMAVAESLVEPIG